MMNDNPTSVIAKPYVRDPKGMNLEADLDLSNVVIIDLGTCFTKVGWSGQDSPLKSFPSVLCEYDFSTTDGPAIDGAQIQQTRVLVGDEISDDATRAVEPADPTELAHVEHIVRYGLQEVGNVGFPMSEVHVLLTEAPCTPIIQRQKIVTRLLQNFQNLKSIGVMNSAVLALFSCGRTRGLVVDAGHTMTSAVPIFEGYAIPHSTFCTNIAGGAVTRALKQACKEENPKSFEGHEIETFAAMKEKICRARVLSERANEFAIDFLNHISVEYAGATDAQKILAAFEDETTTSERLELMTVLVQCWVNLVEDGTDSSVDISALARDKVKEINSAKIGENQESNQFELGDGQVVEVNEARFSASEILFDGNQDQDSVTDVAFKAIAACDQELQLDLVKNLVIVGGTSLLPGFALRFKHDLEAKIEAELSGPNHACLHPDLARTGITIIVDSMRKEAAWIGGSMFASMSTFSHFCVSREDVEVVGRSEVNQAIAEKAI